MSRQSGNLLDHSLFITATSPSRRDKSNGKPNAQVVRRKLSGSPESPPSNYDRLERLRYSE